jgi:ubiquinone biosynthesis protein COQ9
VANAAAELGIGADLAQLAFSAGAADMIDAWFDSIDHRMADRLPAERLATMKIRQRILSLVEVRLDLLSPDREALRRALAVLAQPQHLLAAGRLAWRAADRMWRLAGDIATDYNHYTKRALLSGIYSATLLVFIDDDSDGAIATRGFLNRRIDGIMRFEKTKARMLAARDRSPSLVRFIGRLRYPAI